MSPGGRTMVALRAIIKWGLYSHNSQGMRINEREIFIE